MWYIMEDTLSVLLLVVYNDKILWSSLLRNFPTILFISLW
jgi:hypothetical protein